MARKKKRRGNNGESWWSSIRDETKKSITGIVLIGISLVLFLAAFGAAGPAGKTIYGALDGLFGIGYYLIPVILLTVGVLFLVSHEQKFFSIVFFGALFFVLSGLGLIDVLFEEQAGLAGRLLGSLEIPFGRAAAIIILIMLAVTSLLITLNASISLRMPSFLKKAEKEDGRSAELEDKDLVVKSGNEELTAEDLKRAERERAAKEKQAKKGEANVVNMEEPVISLRKSKGADIKNYVAPPLSLLNVSTDKPQPGDLRANANIIKRTLESFGIPVEMGEINIGPKVTRYTLKPAEGVKITRITALGQDLALALAAHPIRIEAPIPGKSLVGIEVPNKQASVVRLGSLIGMADFMEKGPLFFPMGRDVTGEAIHGNIESLPHLLIAGATGSGKSIFLHSILISFLYKNSPEMLKMILIDPKRVELSIYEGIPHLISPVITEGKKSIAVFRWALNEMDRRYEMLQKAGARDINSYNKKNKDEPLPFVLIVIDEMADLMAQFGREVEGYIVRLAQMARATGIHLILATQRPSVEVVTGLIKANITGRVALQVNSQIDSRTILDGAGAEKLLGNGDLLFISQEFSKPKRIQGGYIGEKEIQDVVAFIKEHNAVLDPSEASDESRALANAMSPAPAGTDEAKSGDVFDDYMGTNDDEDDLLPEAVELVKSSGKASATLFQRRLKVGYARAARILDIMEEKGLIGPADGAKAREIYMDTGDSSPSGEGDEENF
ncbi:MAG: cell division protein FtsK [Candidatus Harrisonbacteria bacterium CG10_big_fil_rev_8_21_14_0_10_49_15]|uniref:Cell division protein FtsK n=1 Tax=Candidatus Harrisonbacteria bacterium CG10_big_fil_rev_8_21_14_0_10_49_15 TaxID=1974587 RepID=A0A2H0UJU9_9BACT|nr:MAG: cell division protein FtsK [Candidatus Harrisonbacteria bacterium CG10_big_fil_rev_8_21_14_0_10_49_15]